MKIYTVTYSYKPPPHIQQACRERGYNILVGTAVMANVGELEDEVREGFPRRLRKELTGVVQGVSLNRRFLVS